MAKEKHKRKEEPTKIFFDMLFECRNLIYIFKYGFYWDNDMTGFLLSKSSQRVRELVNIISDSVYENSVSTPWSLHAPGGAKKSGRLLIRPNHYRLVQNRWFQDLCGCCGSFRDDLAQRYMTDCKKGPYSECRDEENGACVYRRLCMFQEEREIFLKLLDGVKGSEKKNEFYNKIRKRYEDIIDTSHDCLKGNTWREIFSDPGSEPEDGKKDTEYYRFLDMIRFFSGFTPLSVLGGNFLKRQDYRLGLSYILVRNLPRDFEFEQEYLHRCLYAINKKMTVIYEDKEYIPIYLFYRDKDMFGVEEHLYLEAALWENGKGDWENRKELPLFGGVHVRPGRRLKEELPEQGKCRRQETREFQVEFYYNRETGYLKDRREQLWRSCIAEEKFTIPDRERIMTSPYYPDMKTWKIDQVTYNIRVCDIPGFVQFVRSFGDFASMDSLPEEIGETRPEAGRRQKGLIEEQESLLSVYNSDLLIEEARERNKQLPPRQTELWWLDFILKQYPHFCSIFLDPGTLEKIKDKLKKDCTGLSWFDENRFDFHCRVRDLDKRVCSKYRRILDAIYEGRVLQYEYNRKQVRILPYALEYDVTRHLAGGGREPMDVMCYQMDEMRTVNISYGGIQTRTGITRAEYSFSQLEKLYHVLAYAIRCGTEGRQEIDKRAGRLLECMWKTDSRGGDNYNRCIRKKLKQPKSFLVEYDRFEKLCSNQDREEAEIFFHRVFDYLKRAAGESEDRYPYEAFLLSCFTDGCSRLWKPRAGRDVEAALEAIDDLWIWELIMGAPQNGVLNEIAFYNENLKNAVVSFVLKDVSEEAVRRVYDMFRNFICAGEKTEDGRLRFTVSYEKFFFRKIHMAFMTLDDLVEELEPEEVASVISKRIKNKGEYSWRTVS